jgi:hypothetical protein
MTLERGVTGRDLWFAVFAALWCLGRPLAAQPTPLGTAPDAERAAAPTDSASDAQSRESAGLVRARAAVRLGEQLFAAANFDAALADARQYIVLHNIAVCHERLFRYDLALRFYARYLAEGGARAEDRAEVVAVVRTLRSLLATLRITTNVPAEVWIGQRHVGDAPGDVLVPAGHHMIELRAKIFETSRREIQVGTGDTVLLHFELARLSQREGLHPVYFWIGTGLTAASLIVGGVLGATALASHADAQDKSTAGLNIDAEKEQIRTQARAADICFGSAIVLGLSSVLLYFMTDWNEHAPADNALSANLAADPVHKAFVVTLSGGLP